MTGKPTPHAHRLTRRQALQAGVGVGAAGGFLAIGASSSRASFTPSEASVAAGAIQDATPRPGGNLIAAGSGDIRFDPYFNFVPAVFAYSQIFGALFDYRGADPLVPNPQLAESWDETDTELTITLKENFKFQNGRTIVAQDIVDNIARAKDPDIGHYLFATFDSSVESAEAIDDRTVHITYKSVHPVKLDDLAILFLIPKEAMDDVDQSPVGSGPFAFQNYSAGDSLLVERFEEYPEPDLPYLDSVTVKIIPDPSARLANLLSGDVDVVDALAASDAVRLRDDDRVQIVTMPPGGAWYANVLNCGKPPFDNKLVRQAINYTLDREKINQLAYYGAAPITQSRYLPDNFWFNPEAETFYSYDLEKARALLAEAGVPDGFSTSIAISEAVLPGSRAMAQVWQQDLAEVGIELTIDEREQGPFYDEYFAGNFEIQAYGLGDGRFDPATYLLNNSPYRTTDNKARIETQPFFEEYVQLIADGMSSIDPDVRKPIYDRIQMIIAEEGFAMITAFRLTFTGLSPRVQGYRPTIAGGYYFGDVWLSE
jgi:peptide/nickel transport system substrate-binding protein